MNGFQKFIVVVCIILSSLFLFPQSDNNVSAKAKKYLVLIQNVDGETWIAYEEGLIQEKDSNIMIDAKKISNLLYFTFTNISSNKFIISRGSLGNSTYTIGKKKYTYDDSELFERNAPYAPYIRNKTTYIHYSALGYFVKFKHYSSTKAKEFAKKGYDGVLCYSRYFSINNVPDLSKVLDSKGKAFFSDVSTPTPAPTPTPIPIVNTVDSKTSNYLVLIGNENDMSGEYEYWGYKGVVEVNAEGKVMINANLLTSQISYADTPVYYYNIDENRFSIGNKAFDIFTRNEKVKYDASDVYGNKINEEFTIYSESACYTSNNNGWDYIDPNMVGWVFPNTSYYFFDSSQAKAYANKGYDGVLLFVYGTNKKLPSLKKVVRTYDFTNISKKELDTFPSTEIMGVKIYGTETFKKPSDIKTNYSTWGYCFDMDSMKGIVERENVSSGLYLTLTTIEYTIISADANTIQLWQGKNDEYYLNISSRYKVSLTNWTGEFSDFSEDYDSIAWRNRDILKAILYKISSTPEILYDSIVDSWSDENEKYNINEKFVVVGDTKIKYDYVDEKYIQKYCYVIKAAK